MDDFHDFGPIEIFAFGIDRPTFDGGIADELMALEESGTIRILDAAMVIREDEDTLSAIDIESEILPGRPLLGSIVGALIGFGAGGDEGARAGAELGAEAGIDPVTSDDLLELAEELPIGGVAVVVVWENLWSGGLRAALRNSDAYLIADELITAEDLVEFGADLAADLAGE